MRATCILLLLFLDTFSFYGKQELTDKKIAGPSLIVLGTIQDGGSPHIGCTRACCRDLFEHPDPTRKVVSLGVMDPQNKKTWLFEATPDMPAQLNMLKKASGFQQTEMPSGIFLTHAHIGHYSGLMYLGKEAMGADRVPVYTMPGMKTFLETNGPWSQLIAQNNIATQLMESEQRVKLSSLVSVTPVMVPHRDEFSETAGYKIEGMSKKVLFIPDINKWNLWKKNIIAEIAAVDYAFIDATFYDSEEISSRDMSQIPHPFVVESMALFNGLPASEKNKIYFIHFNHTNPLINAQSKQAQEVLAKGFHIAQFGQRIDL